MGLQIQVTIVMAQLAKLNIQYNHRIAKANSVRHKIQAFIDSETLEGKAYDSMKEYYSAVHVPLLRGEVSFANEVLVANERYLTYLQTYFDGLTYICEDELVQELANVRKILESTSINPMFEVYQDSLHLLESMLMRQLQNIQEFEVVTRNLYEKSHEILKDIERGISCMKKISFNTRTEKHDFSKVDLDWAEELNRFYIEDGEKIIQKYAINFPKDIFEEDRIKLVLALRIQESYLSDHDGWDNCAIQVYFDEVFHVRMKKGYDFSVMGKAFAESKVLGSCIYERMFKAYGSKNENTLKEQLAKQKIKLIVKHMGGYLDKNGVLHLSGDGYRFDSNLPPHGKFLETCALCIQEVSIKENKQDTTVQQLQAYIHQHNIEYIRNNFDGKTYFEKL